MSNLPASGQAVDKPSRGLFSASQVSAPAIVSVLAGIAVVLAFDRLYEPTTAPNAVDRLLTNGFNQLILGLFIAAALYAILQALGLAFDTRQLRRLRDAAIPALPFENVVAFITGRAPIEGEDGLLGASRRWYRTVQRADDFLVLSEHLLAARERQYAVNLGPIQYAAWAMPLLGFIGTVVGISASIEGLQVVASDLASGAAGLDTVLDGLQFAFDTTFVGLVLVLPTVALLMPLRARGEAVAMSFHEELLEEYYTRGAGAGRRET